MSFTPRYIVNCHPTAPPVVIGHSIEIIGEEYRHLSRSHRLAIGDAIEVLLRPSKRVFRATVTELTRDHAVVLLGHELSPTIEHPTHLICGAIDERLSDQIVDQCVQLGISSISFFAAERSQRPPREDRQNRWERIADSALKQSGFHDFKGISLYPSLAEGLRTMHTAEALGQNRVVFCAPDSASKTLSVLNPLRRHFGAEREVSHDKNAENLELQPTSQNAESYLIVGPEGGLTEEEIDTAARYHYRRVSFGPKTFRTETAAVICSAFFVLRS